MTRSLTVVAVAALSMVSAGSAAYAQTLAPIPCERCATRAAAGPRLAKLTQTRADESGNVLFTVVAAPGEARLTAEGPAVKFEKVSSEAGIAVRIEAAGDVIEFHTNTMGLFDLKRGGKTKKYRTRELKADHLDAVQTLVAGSAAMQAFESLANALEESDRPEAISVLTTYALVNVLRGNSAGTRTLVRKLKARTEKNLRQVAQRTRGDGGGPDACWDAYEGSVYRLALELDRCMRDNLWNPFMQAACSAEWLIRAELAWTWLIACSGGLPVR